MGRPGEELHPIGKDEAKTWNDVVKFYKEQFEKAKVALGAANR